MSAAPGQRMLGNDPCSIDESASAIIPTSSDRYRDGVVAGHGIAIGVEDGMNAASDIERSMRAVSGAASGSARQSRARSTARPRRRLRCGIVGGGRTCAGSRREFAARRQIASGRCYGIVRKERREYARERIRALDLGPFCRVFRNLGVRIWTDAIADAQGE